VVGTDYNFAFSGHDSSGYVNEISITWLPGGSHPKNGVSYNVTYAKVDCGDPTIAGVEKHVAPTQNSQANSTNSSQTSVDGYTAVSECDMALAMDDVNQACQLYGPTGTPFGTFPGGISLPQFDMNNVAKWILPIAQTNTGWDSVIHVTNVSGIDVVGVNALFYAANGQGNAGQSTQLFSISLDIGESYSFDLMTDGGFPAGKVGSVWIEGNKGVVASVDRVKAATNMALTNVAQPRNDNAANYIKLVGKSPTIKYAPLVFKDYNNWNTGINVANLSSSDNTVTVTYYNYLDNSTSVDVRTIPSRAMEYFYTPGTGNDIGLGSTGVSAAIVQGTQPLAAAVDEVKYTGNATTTSGIGHAMSYPAQYGA
jgi:hypothetical protein